MNLTSAPALLLLLNNSASALTLRMGVACLANASSLGAVTIYSVEAAGVGGSSADGLILVPIDAAINTVGNPAMVPWLYGAGGGSAVPPPTSCADLLAIAGVTAASPSASPPPPPSQSAAASRSSSSAPLPSLSSSASASSSAPPAVTGSATASASASVGSGGGGVGGRLRQLGATALGGRLSSKRAGSVMTPLGTAPSSSPSVADPAASEELPRPLTPHRMRSPGLPSSPPALAPTVSNRFSSGRGGGSSGAPRGGGGRHLQQASPSPTPSTPLVGPPTVVNFYAVVSVGGYYSAAAQQAAAQRVVTAFINAAVGPPPAGASVAITLPPPIYGVGTPLQTELMVPFQLALTAGVQAEGGGNGSGALTTVYLGAPPGINATNPTPAPVYDGGGAVATGLSTGALAGVVLGIMVVVGGFACCILFAVGKRRSSRAKNSALFKRPAEALGGDSSSTLPMGGRGSPGALGAHNPIAGSPWQAQRTPGQLRVGIGGRASGGGSMRNILAGSGIGGVGDDDATFPRLASPSDRMGGDRSGATHGSSRFVVMNPAVLAAARPGGTGASPGLRRAFGPVPPTSSSSSSIMMSGASRRSTMAGVLGAAPRVVMGGPITGGAHAENLSLYGGAAAKVAGASPLKASGAHGHGHGHTSSAAAGGSGIGRRSTASGGGGGHSRTSSLFAGQARPSSAASKGGAADSPVLIGSAAAAAAAALFPYGSHSGGGGGGLGIGIGVGSPSRKASREGVLAVHMNPIRSSPSRPVVASRAEATHVQSAATAASAPAAAGARGGALAFVGLDLPPSSRGTGTRADGTASSGGSGGAQDPTFGGLTTGFSAEGDDDIIQPHHRESSVSPIPRKQVARTLAYLQMSHLRQHGAGGSSEDEEEGRGRGSSSHSSSHSSGGSPPLVTGSPPAGSDGGESSDLTAAADDALLAAAVPPPLGGGAAAGGGATGGDGGSSGGGAGAARAHSRAGSSTSTAAITRGKSGRFVPTPSKARSAARK